MFCTQRFMACDSPCRWSMVRGPSLRVVLSLLCLLGPYTANFQVNCSLARVRSIRISLMIVPVVFTQLGESRGYWCESQKLLVREPKGYWCESYVLASYFVGDSAFAPHISLMIVPVPFAQLGQPKGYWCESQRATGERAK